MTVKGDGRGASLSGRPPVPQNTLILSSAAASPQRQFRRPLQAAASDAAAGATGAWARGLPHLLPPATGGVHRGSPRRRGPRPVLKTSSRSESLTRSGPTSRPRGWETPLAAGTEGRGRRASGPKGPACRRGRAGRRRRPPRPRGSRNVGRFPGPPTGRGRCRRARESRGRGGPRGPHRSDRFWGEERESAGTAAAGPGGWGGGPHRSASG